VCDGENGFLVPWRSAETFAVRVGSILADAELRRRMSAAALATARRFHWQSVAAELDTLYTRLWIARAASGCHDVAVAGVTEASEHELCHIG
jgi:hypothetical protein